MLRDFCGIAAARLAILFCCLLPSGSIFAQQVSKDRIEELRKIVERDTRLKFEKAVIVLNERQKAKNVSAGTYRKAMDGIKNIFYYEAYSWHSCVLATLNTSFEDAEQCKKAKSIAREKYSKLASYPRVVARSADCEMRSRLYEEEIDFPPFDFLKVQEGENYLLDFDALNKCVMN